MSATATAEATPQKKKTNKVLEILQRLGRSFMLPIASLPAAALLLRLGQPDLLGADGLGWGAVAEVIGAAGNGLFDNLPLLFAVGVAVGFAKKSDGSTALAAVIGYLVFKKVGDAMSPHVLGAAAEGEEQALINYNVLGGIIIGITAALLYQRFYRVKLPPYLAFFGGRRFVPIITAAAATVIAVIMAFPYPAFQTGLDNFSEWIIQHSVVGGFVYGTANRLLIPFGLHHLLNNIPWFQVGSYKADGATWQGDIARFLHGDPTAGAFMTGFFPIMMFALPAAAIAIWHAARPERRKAVGGVMLAVALTAFLTGVTEPLEFAFMFVAFPLYVVHALLTGASLAIMNAIGAKDGFGFSAGLFDFVLNWNKATQPVTIIIAGLIFAALYYVIFRWAIVKFDLPTPGREREGMATGDGAAGVLVDDGGEAAEADAKADRTAARRKMLAEKKAAQAQQAADTPETDAASAQETDTEPDQR